MMPICFINLFYIIVFVLREREREFVFMNLKTQSYLNIFHIDGMSFKSLLVLVWEKLLIFRLNTESVRTFMIEFMNYFWIYECHVILFMAVGLSQ